MMMDPFQFSVNCVYGFIFFQKCLGAICCGLTCCIFLQRFLKLRVFTNYMASSGDVSRTGESVLLFFLLEAFDIKQFAIYIVDPFSEAITQDAIYLAVKKFVQ